eukprot:925555-Alexandrium_andersonii.AAC.1
MPLRVCWLVRQAPDVACPARQRVAAELLSFAGSASESDHKLMQWKVATHFEQDLRATSTTGMLTDSLHRLIMTMVRCIPCSTQEIEGMNSM